MVVLQFQEPTGLLRTGGFRPVRRIPSLFAGDGDQDARDRRGDDFFGVRDGVLPGVLHLAAERDPEAVGQARFRDNVEHG